MSGDPLLTVITPALDAAATIERTLASVRTQTQAGIEHLVVDGGSRDGTPAIAAAAGARVLPGPDAGVYDAMSRGVRAARGAVLHILNADDAYAHPQVAERALAALAGGAALCHGRVRQVRADGSPVHVFGCAASRRQLLAKMRVAHPSLFVRREVYARFGTFSPGFRIAGDHEWVLRVWERVPAVFLDEVLVEMRVGGLSTRPGMADTALRESAAAALLHGGGPLRTALRCHLERFAYRWWFAHRYR